MSESASNRRKPSVIFTVVTATLIRNASQLETSVARALYFSFGFPLSFWHFCSFITKVFNIKLNFRGSLVSVLHISFVF